MVEAGVSDLRRILELAVKRGGESVAIEHRGGFTTYAELASDSSAIALGLLENGLKTGDRVLILLGNTLEHVLLTGGLAWGGFVSVPLNVRASQNDIVHVIADAKISALVFDDPTFPVQLHVAGVDTRSLLLIYAGEEVTSDYLNLGDVMNSGKSSHLVSAVPSETDLACILYTSGTTGKPKGLANTHAHVTARILAWILHFGPTASWPVRMLGASPLFHITGLHCGLWVTWSQSGTYVIPAERTSQEYIRTIKEKKISYLLGAPTLFERWSEQANEYGIVLPDVRLAVMGSAPRPSHLVGQLLETFPNALLAEAYGNTEGVMLGSSDLVSNPGAFRSAGDLEARVVKPGGSADEICPPGIEGELIVNISSARIVDHYLNNADATGGKYREGWLRTGDAFHQDADGSLWITGRLDDMFISGGENVQPVEVESVLIQHASLIDVAVVGVPDPKWGSLCTAFIVPSAQVDIQEIDSFCIHHPDLANFKRPKRYVIVEAIPRNALGKIIRHELRNALIANELQGQDI
jgi:2-furoate---CoA ligase